MANPNSAEATLAREEVKGVREQLYPAIPTKCESCSTAHLVVAHRVGLSVLEEAITLEEGKQLVAARLGPCSGFTDEPYPVCHYQRDLAPAREVGNLSANLIGYAKEHKVGAAIVGITGVAAILAIRSGVHALAKKA